jgi:predicted amidohydrolase
MSRFTLATAQYPIDQLQGWGQYVDKITAWVSQAAEGGAKLAVFPEYGAMELAAYAQDAQGGSVAGDLAASLAAVAGQIARLDALHRGLAVRFGLHILAASTPCALPDGRIVNRARLFTPHGRMGHQDKLVMTRFEAEQWGVAAGDPVVNVFDTEFPLIARAAMEQGAQLLLVPSCTDSAQGYWRVRIGSQARALEGQCYVVQACTVGAAPWSAAVDANHGAAGVYGPPDAGLAAAGADGVLALGSMDAAAWVFCEVDLDGVGQLRRQGQVLNLRDWARQPGAAALPKAQVVDLRH